MSKVGHKSIEFLHLQTVYIFTDLRVYEFIGLSCQNTDFHSHSVFQEKSYLIY